MLLTLSRTLRARPFLVIPLFLCAYGFGRVDLTDYYRLSSAPFELHSEVSRQFLQSSPLPYMLGAPLTAMIGPVWSFAIVMLGGLLLAAAALRRLVTVRYGSDRHDATLMFLATPLLIVLTQYVGKSDSYLVAFLLLLVSSSTPWIQVVLSGLAVLSHFEMGLIVLTLAVFLRLLPIRTTLAGAAIAVAMIYVYHYYLLPSPPQSRADAGASYLADAIDAVLRTPVQHLMWSFGPFWWCVWQAPSKDWRWRAVCGACAVLAIATLDFTRVFVLTGLPLIVATIDRVLAPNDAAADAVATPRWFDALPVLPFVQAHLIAGFVYDSRVPEWITRLSGYLGR